VSLAKQNVYLTVNEKEMSKMINEMIKIKSLKTGEKKKFLGTAYEISSIRSVNSYSMIRIRWN